MSRGPLQRIPVVFYRTPGGVEIVLEWLPGLEPDDRNQIGRDLMRIQFGWPVGMPLCRPLGDGLWEVRSNLARNRTMRVLFAPIQGRLVVLHGFVKKSQTTPETDLDAGPPPASGIREVADMKKQKPARQSDDLTTLDDFLAAEGKLEEFEVAGIKEVLAWQIGEAMRERKLSRRRLAEQMGTSRSQVSRLLDPTDGNVTIATLQRAARVVGRVLRLELV